jgi:hypothetical protein
MDIKMYDRYVRQLEEALADTWRVLEDSYEEILEAGIVSRFDELHDKHKDAIELAMYEVEE